MDSHEEMASLAGRFHQRALHLACAARAASRPILAGRENGELLVAPAGRGGVFCRGLGPRLALALLAASREGHSHPGDVSDYHHRVHGQQHISGAGGRSVAGGGAETAAGRLRLGLPGHHHRRAHLRRRGHAGLCVRQSAGIGETHEQFRLCGKHPTGRGDRDGRIPGRAACFLAGGHVPRAQQQAWHLADRAPAAPAPPSSE